MNGVLVVCVPKTPGPNWDIIEDLRQLEEMYGLKVVVINGASTALWLPLEDP